MSKISTKQALLLMEALQKRGVIVEAEHWDGHKHIDIYIPHVDMYIEVDGLYHYTHPDQIMRDFNRNHYSDGDGFDTMHIPNELIETHLEEIANAIANVVKKRVLQIVEKIKI